MSVLKGSVTLTRFRVNRDPSADAKDRERFVKVLRSLAFEPIDVAGEDGRAAGWVSVEDHQEPVVRAVDCWFSQHLLASYRVDRLTVPSAQVRRELDAWAKTYTEEHGRPPAKADRMDMRLAIARRLRARIIPSSRTADLSWNLDTDQICVWSSSAALVAEIIESLEPTLAMRLHRCHVANAPGAPKHFGPTTLGQAFLTWLLNASLRGVPLTTVMIGLPVSVTFEDKIVVRHPTGCVREVTARGAKAPLSSLVTDALKEGSMVHSATLALKSADRWFRFTLDADMTIRAGRLPALLTKEAEERLQERLALVNHLGRALDALVLVFLEQYEPPDTDTDTRDDSEGEE